MDFLNNKHAVHKNMIGGSSMIGLPLVIAGPEFQGASNYGPSVASDQNTDTKVSGLNPFISVSGQES